MKSDAVSVLRAPSWTRRASLPLGMGFSKKPPRPHGKSPSCGPRWGRGRAAMSHLKKARIRTWITDTPSPNLWGFGPWSKFLLVPVEGAVAFAKTSIFRPFECELLMNGFKCHNSGLCASHRHPSLHILCEMGGKKPNSKHLSERLLWYLQLVLKICLAKEKKAFA